jgi:hypothetical protein
LRGSLFEVRVKAEVVPMTMWFGIILVVLIVRPVSPGRRRESTEF